jgi:hypothetical protein
MKSILSIVFAFLILIGVCEPCFASAKYPAQRRPIYYGEYNYIKDNNCKAVSMIPYSGDVLYECPNGDSFWSEVLVPTKDSPLFMYFKNRKHEDDADDSAAASASVATY